MKNILFIIFIVFPSLKIHAQELNGISDDKVYKFVQKKAEPKIGMEKFYLDFKERFFIEDNSVLENEIDVRFKFIVEKDGSFTDIQILDDKLNFGDKVINILKKMPAWNPAVHNDKIVRSSFILRVKLPITDRKETVD